MLARISHRISKVCEKSKSDFARAINNYFKKLETRVKSNSITKLAIPVKRNPRPDKGFKARKNSKKQKIKPSSEGSLSEEEYEPNSFQKQIIMNSIEEYNKQ